MIRRFDLKELPESVLQGLGDMQANPSSGSYRLIQPSEQSLAGLVFMGLILLASLAVGVAFPDVKPFVLGGIFLVLLAVSWAFFGSLAQMRKYKSAPVKPMFAVSPSYLMRVNLDRLLYARIDDVTEVTQTEIVRGTQYVRTDVYVALKEGRFQFTIRSQVSAADFVQQLRSNRKQVDPPAGDLFRELKNMQPGKAQKPPFNIRRAAAAFSISALLTAAAWCSSNFAAQVSYLEVGEYSGDVRSMEEYFERRFTMPLYSSEMRQMLIDRYRKDWKKSGKKHSMKHLLPGQKNQMLKFYETTKPGPEDAK